MIPQRLVGEDLFSGKFAGKVWIHREKKNKKQNGASDNLWGKIWQLWTNVAPFSLVYFILVQFYRVRHVYALIHEHYYDRVLIFYAVKLTFMLKREIVDP